MAVYSDTTLTYELNRLANGGTYPAGVLSSIQLDDQGAANKWAATSGLSTVGALNVKAGTSGLGLNLVCNVLAVTSGLEARDALFRRAT